MATVDLSAVIMLNSNFVSEISFIFLRIYLFFTYFTLLVSFHRKSFLNYCQAYISMNFENLKMLKIVKNAGNNLQLLHKKVSWS